MDRSKALHQLLEAADLVGMIEDLTDPARMESLAPTSLSGMRITLRTIREAIIGCHQLMAADLVARARAQVGTLSEKGTESQVSSNPAIRQNITISGKNSALEASSQVIRKDLKSTLEKTID